MRLAFFAIRLSRWIGLAASVFCVLGAPSARAAASDRQLMNCDHAALHAGSCVEPAAGRLALLIDAQPSSDDRCRAAAPAGGEEEVLCRYDGTDWREFVRRPETSSAVALGATELVFDILDPPPESGLTPPVGDGIDGQPLAPRTNDAPAIIAAIEYACANDYDVAYLGPGTYRIGASGTGASFYTGIRIDAKRCPNGIKFYGAGAGRTILLANGEAGQYVVYTTDQYSDPTKVLRIGWNTSGGTVNPKVTGITTSVTPPVISGSGDPFLDDGDTVYVRNCSGTVQANDRAFKVDNCSEQAPFSCELQDEAGNDVDATPWSPWTADSECIVTKLNTHFDTEIAYLTIRDDDPEAHSTTVCDPICEPAEEESHGIGILQGGGRVEVHHVVIDSAGDEAIDISAPESPTYVHDVTVLDPQMGGTPVYQGVGVRIEDVLIQKLPPGPGDLPPYSSGDGFTVDAGSHNWRIVDLRVSRTVVLGHFRTGFKLFTNSTGIDGQYVSGVHVTDSAIRLEPSRFLCDGPQEFCGAFYLQARSTAHPMENVVIARNTLSGAARMKLENGEGGVLMRDNTMTPIPGIPSQWGVIAGAKRTTLQENDISGFARGCIQYEPYATQGGANASVTLEIEGNSLSCRSNANDEDPMIGGNGSSSLGPAPEDEGYFRILDNAIIASASDFIRYGVKISEPWKNAKICRNTISLDPAIPVTGSVGIWSQMPDQLICDNEIDLNGSGIRVDADGSKIAGNQIQGFDVAFAAGILVVDASDVLLLENRVSQYRQISSSGIEVEAGAQGQSRIQIVGNVIGASGKGIYLEGKGVGIDDATIAGNTVDMNGFGSANAILLEDATNVRVTVNDLLGLTSGNSNALLTTGSSDFILVRDNLAEGGGTLRFGTMGGDASCNPTGVGSNSTCSNNRLQ